MSDESAPQPESIPVYRREDGKLVPLPNNTRRLGRRYNLVVSADQTYLVEFTDEEELARDAQERFWKERRPIIEAEREKQRREHEEFRNSLVYEDRTIAFIDVLGWRRLIADSVNNSELAKSLGIALSGLGSHIKMAKWLRDNSPDAPWTRDVHITQFSDCIVISYKYVGRSESATPDEIITKFLSSLAFQFHFLGIFVRGSVTRGPLIHRESIVYGPALVEAYELEQKSAFWPRVILSDKLASEWEGGYMVLDRDGKRVLGRRTEWARDVDGRVFYDFLAPELFSGKPGGLSELYLREYRKHIEGGLKKYSEEPSVFDKYVWLARYFNSVVVRLDLATVSPIEIGKPATRRFDVET